MNVSQALKLCNYENAKIFAEQVKCAAIESFPQGQRWEAIKFANKLIDVSETVRTSTKIFLGFTAIVLISEIYCLFKLKSISKKAQEIFDSYGREEHPLHGLRNNITDPIEFLSCTPPTSLIRPDGYYDEYGLITLQGYEARCNHEANHLLRTLDLEEYENPTNDSQIASNIRHRALKPILINDMKRMSELRISKFDTKQFRILNRLHLFIPVISALAGIYNFKEMKNLAYFPQALELFKTRAAYAPPIFN